MDWAKDTRGQIVRAQRGVYFGIGMTCPTCGESVHLRQGKKRRPHFAHYSNRAKPDCEFYHPPLDVIQRSTSQSSINNASLYPKRESILCGLFLVYRTDVSGFELSLRIPSIASDRQLNGTLKILHSTGTKEFTAKQLTKSYTTTVAPKVPLLDCEGDGDLLALSDHIIDQASSFKNGMNMFVVSESRGRFLFKSEPLEWGGRYWVVTDAPIIPPTQVTAHVEWNRRGSLAQWHVYEAELPSTFVSSKYNAVKEALSEFFSRLIRPRQPRAYIVHPLPHHFGLDGAYVYPHSPEVLYIRRTSPHEISVEGPHNLIANVEIVSLADDFIQIKGIQTSSHDLTIQINGIEQAVIRNDVCDLIQPSGLDAYNEEINWDLLVDTTLRQEELFSQEIKVICGSDRLAQYVAKTNEAWVLDGSKVILPINTDKTISAGGFGEIRPVSSKIEDNQGQETVNKNQGIASPKVTWIVSLIRNKYGPQSAAVVSDYIENPSRVNLQKLGPILTSSLMTYIHASSELHQQLRNVSHGISRN